MARKIKPSEVESVKKMFQEADVNKDGQLSHEEMKKFFSKYGFTDMDIADMISKADADGSGTIDFNELLYEDIRKPSKELFQKYDKNGDGYLGPEEIVPMAKELGYTNLSVAQVEALIKKVDTNNDGRLNFDEFLALSTVQ